MPSSLACYRCFSSKCNVFKNLHVFNPREYESINSNDVIDINVLCSKNRRETMEDRR